MTITYEKLHDLIASAIPTKSLKLVFSMGDMEEESNGEYLYDVPFDSLDDIFVKGKASFNTNIRYYDPAKKESWYKTVKSKVFTNLTWKDIVKVANRFAWGDHRFLETIRLSEEKSNIKYYHMDFGS